MLQGKAKKAIIDDEGALTIQGHLCGPQVDELILDILENMHIPSI